MTKFVCGGCRLPPEMIRHGIRLSLDVFVAYVRSNADDVAFIHGNDRERVGLEQVRDGRIFAALETAPLDRPGDIVAAFEAEAHDRMSHFGAGRIGHEQIERSELGKMGSRCPSLREVS